MEYEIIKARHYVNLVSGITASLYGALPWRTENEKLAWAIKESGWTVRNPHTNEIGIGRKPFATFADAAKWAAGHKPSRNSIAN